MASSRQLQEFVDEALREHNKHRSLHGAEPLRHSPALDKSAQEWAERLVEMTKLENSPVSSKGDVGENISMRTSSTHHADLMGTEVVDQWYGDIKNYDFSKGSGPAGNFTQLVWIGSREVGFGKAHKGGKCIVVAHYKPAGNVRGRYLENVKPAKQGSVPGPCQPCAADSVIHGHVTKESVVTETEMQPDGKQVKVRKEITEYTDDTGKITQRIKEIRLDGEPPQHRTPSPRARTSSLSSDDEFECSVKNLPEDEKRKLRDIRRFTVETVQAHNVYRANHGAPKLRHNKDLDAMAQQWAEHLVRQTSLSNSNHTFKGGRIGENIASRWSNGPCDYTGQEVVDHWYTEQSKFKYDVEPTNVQGIGNFSQLVWRDSREVGVGKAILTAPDSCKVIVVCHYHPAGNVLKCFKENVLKPK